jgi:hypothetical protein
MRRCQFAVKPMRGLHAADRRRIGPKWKAVLRSTKTAGVSMQRPCRRRAGPCSGSPPLSRARSNQKTARSTIALTCRNRSCPLSWWPGCSHGIHRGSHDGMMLLRALAFSACRVLESASTPMRSAGPASIKASRRAAACRVLLNAEPDLGGPGAYAFQWLQNGLASLSSYNSKIRSEHTQQF